MFQKLAELISLGLTVPTILLSIWVVRLYWRPSLEAVRAERRTSVEWFAIGITIGFLGSSLDNLYWAIPWTASYLGYTGTNDLVEAGVFFNIPFRQLCGSIAAYCHIRSVLEYQRVEGGIERPRRLNREVMAWLMLAALLVAILRTVKVWL